jgi:hypothetical protein
VCEWDDVVITGLAEYGSGGVWRSRRGIDGYRVGKGAGGEESALKDVLPGCASYPNAIAR